MGKILIVTVLILVSLSALIMIFVRTGDGVSDKYPESGFAKWFRKHIIDQDPWEN
jgi:hypothetical protein